VRAKTVSGPIASNTGELVWNDGLVTIDSDQSEAFVGFTKDWKPLKHLSAEVKNQFAAIQVSSLDSQPIARSNRLLISAASRVTNTGFKWNDTRTRAVSQGGSPTLIEPVSGTITLRNLDGAKGVSATALDGSGAPVGEPTAGRKTADGWLLAIGDPVTTWYVVSIRH